MTDETITRALQLRAQGLSWRKVAAEVGVNDGNLYTVLQRRGIGDTLQHNESEAASQRKAELRDRWHAIATEATDQLREALGAGEISAGQLPIVAGIATDKVALADRWRDPQPREHDWLTGVATKLAEYGGGSATLTIEVEPARVVDMEKVP
jgi:hypothetical protein